MMVKFIYKYNRPRIAKIIFKINNVGKITLPNFKTYCKAAIIKKLQLWLKNRQQINGIELSPEMKPHIYSQLIFDLDCQDYSVWGRIIFTIKGAGTAGQPHANSEINTIHKN